MIKKICDWFGIGKPYPFEVSLAEFRTEYRNETQNYLKEIENMDNNALLKCIDKYTYLNYRG